ncbi:O-antigen translocase [Flavobacterium sedimenticola]|uniref:O-antigen translocase n=2 Tax=Flavobacterium TaxID=237 RepID=A0ABT6XT61_9FLAO|nr:O-antigen translocase [Flavobacterium sedimenticola]MDI9258256.1 O-antigen translocase [Flavobacterium sedimenticola]
MTDSQSSYRQIIKSTSVFGGVHVFNIVISLIKSKFIALWIGPAGVGMIGLFNSTLNLISSFTNAGIETSGVKAISASEKDPGLLAKEFSILKRLVWISGIIGAVLVALCSPILSRISFGNEDQTLAFGLISLTLLFKQLTAGRLVLLQGLSKIQFLAKANLYGNIIGLLISLPLYYFFKIDGIVPSILFSSFAAMIVAFYFSKKITIEKVKLSNKEVIIEGKHLILLGFSLSFIGLLTTLSSYLLQVFISNYKDIAEVGFYSAGMTILNTYVGIIFTAMATDYYPRLAKICSDSIQVKKMVTQQSIVAVLLLTPIVVAFLIFAPYVIQILYSKEFLPIVPLVCWGILGMIIKAVSWSMGYILIAKGDSKLFVKTSIGFNSIFLITNVLGYYFFGLFGLGITFLVNYGIHFFGLKVIVSRQYGFGFDKTFYKIFVCCIVLCAATFLSLNVELTVLKYILTSILFLTSIWFSFTELNKRLHFKDFLSRKNK